MCVEADVGLQRLGLQRFFNMTMNTAGHQLKKAWPLVQTASEDLLGLLLRLTFPQSLSQGEFVSVHHDVLQLLLQLLADAQAVHWSEGETELGTQAPSSEG